VIDLPCVCDSRTRKAFELADSVLLVTAQTAAAETKLAQFISQNNVYESIKDKVTIVANMDTITNIPLKESLQSLPTVQSDNALEICKALSDSVLNVKAGTSGY